MPIKAKKPATKKTTAKKMTLNPLTRKMEMLNPRELKLAKLVKKAVDGDTNAFIKIMDILDGPVK